jgi:hypothetical protein
VSDASLPQLDGRVPFRRRLALSVALGILAATMSLQQGVLEARPRDFGQAWYAARALLHHTNPYHGVGPGLAFEWPFPLLYPIPAALVALPFAPFAEPWASALFVAVGTGLFAWTLAGIGYGPLFGFFSMAVRSAAAAGQWSPLLAASYGIPSLSFALVAKPTMGLVLFVAHPRRQTVFACVGVVAISLLIIPQWPADWLDAIRRNAALWAPVDPYRALIEFPGGAVALLALLRWRRAEARIVAALACVPMSMGAYEMVPLFLVPRTFLQAVMLVGASWAQGALARNIAPKPWTYETMEPVMAATLIACQLLPATLLVLTRPNEGEVPAWVERAITSWPVWLRGRA